MTYCEEKEEIDYKFEDILRLLKFSHVMLTISLSNLPTQLLAISKLPKCVL